MKYQNVFQFFHPVLTVYVQDVINVILIFLASF